MGDELEPWKFREMMPEGVKGSGKVLSREQGKGHFIIVKTGPAPLLKAPKLPTDAHFSFESPEPSCLYFVGK